MGFWNDVGNFFGVGVGAKPAYTANPADFQAPGQSALAQMLMQQAQGGGPNPWANQLQAATDQNIGNAMAVAQATQGGNNQATLRGILDNAARARQAAAGQYGQIQAQHQLDSEGALGQVLGQEQQGQIAAQQLDAQSKENAGNRDQSFLGGAISGIGTALASLAHGGVVPGYAAGGPVGLGYFGVGTPAPTASAAPMFSIIPKPKPKPTQGPAPATPSQALASGYSGDGTAFNLPSLLTIGGGAGALGGTAGAADAVGAALPMAILAARGGPVPGHARVAGDSAENDTVPARLSPGEVVLPRSVTQAKDAPELAKQFVQSILRTKKKVRAA